MECYWIRNTEATLAGLRRAGSGVAVIPLASIESHGPHLPLGSDPLGIEYIIELVLKKETVAVLPVLPYANVVEARMLPGAIHIRTGLLMDFLENICDEVYRNGFNKIVLLHGHGGNESLTKAFLARILEKEKPYAFYNIPLFAGREKQMKNELETTPLGHACELETSLDMTACPDLVNLKALGNKTFPSQPVPDVGCAQTPVWWTAAYPEMAVGFPRKATPEKGKKIARRWAEGIVESLRLIKKDRRCSSAMKSYIKRSNAIGKH